LSLTPPSQSDFLRECERLNAAQVNATTPEEKAQADDDMKRFLMLNARGQLGTWFDAKQRAAGRDE
jgi:hypothetical protein